MYEHLSDSELVRRFVEGDRQAFEALYSRHDADVLGPSLCSGLSP
jgi:hypothetical protein